MCDPDRDFVIAARAAVHLDGARCRDATDVIVETIDTLLHLVTADRQRRRDLSAAVDDAFRDEPCQNNRNSSESIPRIAS